ncbi:peptide methionine sulfoxide reductase msrB [Mycena rosella]|uniref:Peptide-methionine (R)-S-oxide reductase n=1 Tax=Mycena rosella TaxID=1033263 RepID=A0AAD7DM57_MYCRO|nr:peptide methionine sulfoxide reductase msrB [Mycena rosella]
MASNTDQKTDDEWRAILSPEQASFRARFFRILRQKGTERASTGEYDKHFDEGVYSCAACATPLYKSTTKFDSGCGWPAFFDAIPGAVTRHTDSSWGMERIEIVCTACGGHLGHVFKGEKFDTPTDERHCVNSVSLKFKDGDGVEKSG